MRGVVAMVAFVHFRCYINTAYYLILFMVICNRKKERRHRLVKRICLFGVVGFLNKNKTASDQCTMMMTPLSSSSPSSPRSRQKSQRLQVLWWQRCMRCQQNVTKKPEKYYSSICHCYYGTLSAIAFIYVHRRAVQTRTVSVLVSFFCSFVSFRFFLLSEWRLKSRLLCHHMNP